MTTEPSSLPGIIAISATARVGICVGIVFLMGNLSALADAVVHPEIPYLDPEHVIVGGVTGVVSAIVLSLVALYARQLERALLRIRTLEGFLPICAQCKKIRKPDSDPKRMESWQPIESYISERTAAEFTHGICPECAALLYPKQARR